MEVQNGFIVEIQDYCDRWCETAPRTQELIISWFQCSIRGFVRPAFDEPDEVAKLPAAEGGR